MSSKIREPWEKLDEIESAVLENQDESTVMGYVNKVMTSDYISFDQATLDRMSEEREKLMMKFTNLLERPVITLLEEI